MRFLITMNMPAYSGAAIHQIICEHPAKSIDEFCRALEQNDFLVVDELYRNSKAAPSMNDPYYSVGKTAINHLHIGKIKEFGLTTTEHKGRTYGEAH